MLRNFLLVFAIFIALAVKSQAHDDTYDVSVTSIYDGDTFTANMLIGPDMILFNQKFRVYCVDTPELRGAEKSRGEAVRDATVAWIQEAGAIDVELVGKGKFGRWLAIVHGRHKPTTLNEWLYKSGNAKIEAYSNSGRAACQKLLNIDT